MNDSAANSPALRLQDGAVVAIIGGGPAGAFFAIELLRRARSTSRAPRVVIFERRRTPNWFAPDPAGCWHGCNYCAGGISPKLHEVLGGLGLTLPESVIQSRIQGITIQGFWKNIELEVPPDRQMLSVFRGSRPTGVERRVDSFDSFLLQQAIAEGAKLESAEVLHVARAHHGKPLLTFRRGAGRYHLEADFCVFACGINQHPASGELAQAPLLDCARQLMPGFAPPATRKTLIFELRAHPEIPPSIRNAAFFVEYGSRDLPLEMCSLIPKRDFITVVLIGRAVDRAHHPNEVREIIRRFLLLPHIRRLLFPVSALEPVCLCGPRMTVGVAQSPIGDRVSAVGDFVTSRLYKDGILSAHRTAAALARTVLEHGIDLPSLKAGYGATLRHFRRNNRIAGAVFFVHRVCFSSSVLSRVLYQAVITERKSTLAPRRQLERILWRIASGDDDYEQILRCLLRPATLWAVLGGGALLTLRNYLTELLFGLRWDNLGRFTTGVSLERLAEKSREFRKLIDEAAISLPDDPEFERMYTIKIAAKRELILEQLENFGEGDRRYLRPRGLRVTRVAGQPHEVGCVIRYEVLHRSLSFDLRLEKLYGGHLAVYRVLNGFAKGGVLLFEIEEAPNGISLLSIYVAFNFTRGSNVTANVFWRIFRLLFPSFAHDVLWNHALCQLRDVIERQISTTHTGQPA